MLIQYNFCRTHSAIGCTPAEESGLVIGGDNPWETLYKHATWNRITRGVRSCPQPPEATKVPEKAPEKVCRKVQQADKVDNGQCAGCAPQPQAAAAGRACVKLF